MFQLFCIYLSISECSRGDIKGMAGGSVTIVCRVNQVHCGDFHSIKWYKENKRVFVYSPVVNFTKAEGGLQERGSIDVDQEVNNIN